MSSIAAGVRLNKLFAEFEVLKAEVASLKARVAELEEASGPSVPLMWSATATAMPAASAGSLDWTPPKKKRGRPPKVKNA